MPSSTSHSIYAYCNIRTKQVIYSLKPALNNASVARQLPDTGANTSFVSLRKDLWHPLWTLSFPETENAIRQNLHAFKKLREWRKMHELNWEPPPMLTKPFTEKEIEELQEKLDNRGGSKKESVYDVIKHKKKKMRVKEVLNQKANSIADLAAVLIDQDSLGAETIVRREQETKEDRQRHVNDMLQKAEDLEKGVLAENEARIKELEQMLAKADRLGETEIPKTQLRRKLFTLSKVNLKMKFAAQAVKEARSSFTPRSTTTPSATATGNTNSSDAEFAHFMSVLPGYPIPNIPAEEPKDRHLRGRIRRLNSPIFSTEGVTIKWQNQLDAEYAEAWPENVSHQWMGFTRHRAPWANEEPITDAADERQKRLEKWHAKRKALLEKQRWKAAPEGLEAIKVDVLSKVKEAVEQRREAGRQEREKKQVLA